MKMKLIVIILMAILFNLSLYQSINQTTNQSSYLTDHQVNKKLI
jgi:hypothetical protein